VVNALQDFEIGFLRDPASDDYGTRIACENKRRRIIPIEHRPEADVIPEPPERVPVGHGARESAAKAIHYPGAVTAKHRHHHVGVRLRRRGIASRDALAMQFGRVVEAFVNAAIAGPPL
jgi:hypothetical protein